MTSQMLVQIDELPGSVDEFVALRDRLAVTPEGGAATMVLALLLYAGDEELGRQCLVAVVDAEHLQEGPRGWQLSRRRMQLIERQIGNQPDMARSYIAGATPGNSYQLPEPPYQIECSTNPYSGDLDSGRFKVFVTSSGAASPRPVTLRQDEGGIWKALEWSSLLLGVQRAQ